jgi:hypothetical protein
MVGQDKNKCLQNCDKLKEYQEFIKAAMRPPFLVSVTMLFAYWILTSESSLLVPSA